MGKNMLRLLTFAMDYAGWHSCGRDAHRALARLETLGLLEVVHYENGKLPQFRIRQPKY